MTYTEGLEVALRTIIDRIERVKMKDFETSVLAFNILEDAQKALNVKEPIEVIKDFSSQAML